MSSSRPKPKSFTRPKTDPLTQTTRKPNGRITFTTNDRRLWTRPDPDTSRIDVSWHGAWWRFRKKPEHVSLNVKIFQLWLDSPTKEPLLAFSDKHLDEFNVVNVITCIHRLAKCRDISAWISEDRRFQSLLKVVQDDDFIRFAFGRELSTLAWAMLHLDTSDTQRIMLLISTEVLNRELDLFSITALAILLWSFARADSLFVNLEREKLVTHLCEELEARCPSQFKNEELAMVCWSFAIMEFHIDGEFVTALGAEILRRDMQNFRAAYLVVLTTAFARLTKTDGRDKGAALQSCRQVLLCIAYEISRRNLRAFSLKHLNNMIWAFGKFALADVDDLMHACQLELLRRGFSEFTPVDYFMSAVYFVRYDSHSDKRFAEALGGKAATSSKVFSPQSFIAELTASLLLKEDFTDFDNKHLASLSWAFAKIWSNGWTIRGVDWVFKRLSEEISSRGFKDFTARDIAYIAWAFSKCTGYLADDIVEELARRGPEAFSQDDMKFFVNAFPSMPWPAHNLDAFRRDRPISSQEDMDFYPYWSSVAASWDYHDVLSKEYEVGSAWNHDLERVTPQRKPPHTWIGRKPRIPDSRPEVPEEASVDFDDVSEHSGSIGKRRELSPRGRGQVLCYTKCNAGHKTHLDSADRVGACAICDGLIYTDENILSCWRCNWWVCINCEGFAKSNPSPPPPKRPRS